jgi:hypothetical protein
VATVPTVLPSGTGATLSTTGSEAGAEDPQRDLYLLSVPPDGAASPVPAPAANPVGSDGFVQGQAPPEEEVGPDTLGDNRATDPDVALAPDPTGMSSLIVVSGSIMIIGLGLFALRWTSRRFGG